MEPSSLLDPNPCLGQQRLMGLDLQYKHSSAKTIRGRVLIHSLQLTVGILYEGEKKLRKYSIKLLSVDTCNSSNIL